MKILHLIGGGDIGGAKTHVLTLLCGLMESTAVSTLMLVTFREGGFTDEARELDIPATVISGGGFFGDLKALRKLYREGSYDIVHCHGARGNMMGMLLKLLEKAAVVTTVHSDPKLDYLGRPLANLTYGLINRLSLRKIKYRVGVSDPIVDMLIERGFSPYGMFPIYNGLDFETELKPLGKAEFLSSLGVEYKAGDVICGIAARLNPVKDIPTLLRAFAKTPENMCLIIAGEGEDEAALKSLAEQLGISARTTFAGWVSDMASFYDALDINLLTSLSETFPYALTEGARGRCATIASRVGGVPVLIDHGVCGFLFTPGNMDELTEYLTTLGGDAKLRESFAEALYEKAAREFSLDATISHQIEIYETIHRREKFDKKRRGITICGAYGKNNAGDDAILEAITAEIRSVDPDLQITVLSRKPAATSLAYRTDSIYTFNIFALRKALRRSTLYINGGGNLMQDATSTRSILFYLYTLRAAKRNGCKVMMYGCGIGPIDKKANRRRTARTINKYVDVITLRENGSLDELQALCVRKPKFVLSADPALTLEPAGEAAVRSALLANGADPDGNYICFVLRNWHGFSEKHKIFAAAADYAYKKYGLTPLFLPIEKTKDVEAARSVSALMQAPCHVFENVEGARLTIGIMSRMKIIVSMRLHGLIFAAGSGVPLVGVAYDKKVSAFLEYMEQDLFCELGKVTTENLTALIDKASEKQRMELMLSVERLRKIEGRNVEELREILG